MIYTSNPIQGLLYINNGYESARWNFPQALGTATSNPGGLGQPVTITYSFQSDLPGYARSEPLVEGPITRFSAEYQAATRKALAEFASVANIRFVEADAGEGQMVFRHSWQSGTSGFAYSPAYSYSPGTKVGGPITEMDYAGDVWIDNSELFTGSELQPGGRGYFVLMHEIGHALGLQHSFDDSYGTAPPSYVMTPGLDNERYTVMTYTQASNTETASGPLSAGSLMMLDIQAIQHLYGKNTTHASHRGNTVYTWARNEAVLETIWDGSGVDTFDASQQTNPSIINLNAGKFSSIGYRTAAAGMYDGRDNVAIAKGAVIENAKGGAGADTLIGNAVGNRLDGGNGADSLTGGGGNDTLVGGEGADRMSGGAGNDVYYLRGSDTIVEAAGGGKDIVYTSLAFYSLPATVENARITAGGAADVNGNALNNVVYAGTGDNVIKGGSGIDTVSYARAEAAVRVSLGKTTAQGTDGSGTDTLAGLERLVGSPFADRLLGSAGADTINGGAGNDLLAGGRGRDVLVGGSGKDTFDFDYEYHSGPASTSRDVIKDFVRGQDRIDLSTIDARAATSANEAFQFVGSAGFGADASGQLRFSGGVLYGSTDADSAAEFSLQLVGVTSLSSSDLIL